MADSSYTNPSHDLRRLVRVEQQHNTYWRDLKSFHDILDSGLSLSRLVHVLQSYYSPLLSSVVLVQCSSIPTLLFRLLN